MLKLHLFGTGKARYYDKALPGFPSQLPYSLLCYLLLNRNIPHHRERLAGLFWGDHSTAASRKRLRDVLWRLRRGFQSVGASLDEYLQIDDEGISFQPKNPYWLDVEIFEEAVSLCQDIPGDELGEAGAKKLESASDLYVGELLQGNYEDWCINDRERLDLSFVRALDKLMAYHASKGNYERALACGERILEREDTREITHRGMMRLYWLLGDRNAALAHYERCALILQRTLGIKPMRATRRLYDRMLKNRYRTAGADDEAREELAEGPLNLGGPSHIERAIGRLHQLESELERTRAELRQIERLIDQALTDGARS